MMIRMANIWRIRRNNRLNIKKKSEINKNNMKFLINIIFGICCKLIIEMAISKFTNPSLTQMFLNSYVNKESFQMKALKEYQLHCRE